jgi:hypothetical protein
MSPTKPKISPEKTASKKSSPRKRRVPGESAAPKSPGRPTLYSLKLAQKICDLIATTASSLRVICKLDPTLPSHQTVYRWLCAHKDFRELYARAREMQSYIFSDAMLEISEDSSEDTYLDDEGNERTNHEHIQRSKLRIDTLKWLMEKHAAKVYGMKAIVLDNETDAEKALLKKELAELRTRLDNQYQRDY